jgi:electron-transferring-flavoprotein dehydrogenase
MMCADATFDALTTNHTSAIQLEAYQEAYDKSWIKKELWSVRNMRPSFHSPLGMVGGVLWSGLDSFLLKGRVPWTFSHQGTDAEALVLAK